MRFKIFLEEGTNGNRSLDLSATEITFEEVCIPAFGRLPFAI